ncbi:hypothetical protein R0J87_23495, partial [Halomonas sp. SIMBA_159]
VKLVITQRGTGRVEVRGLTEADNSGLLARRRETGKAPATLAAARAPASSRIDELIRKLPEGTGPANAPARTTASPAAAVAT